MVENLVWAIINVAAGICWVMIAVSTLTAHPTDLQYRLAAVVFVIIASALFVSGAFKTFRAAQEK